MGSEKSKRSSSAQHSQDIDFDELAREAELVPYRVGRRSGAMRVSEAAVMPFAVYADDEYPALVDGILAHAFRVLRELDEQQVDIMLLRDDTRAALARLKAA